jgi:hypothetical protein
MFTMVVPMYSNAHQAFVDSESRRFGRPAGYLLVAVIAVLLLIAVLTNPALPETWLSIFR